MLAGAPGVPRETQLAGQLLAILGGLTQREFREFGVRVENQAAAKAAEGSRK